MPIKLQIQGLDTVAAALSKFPEQIKSAVEVAQNDMARNILDTPGMQNYPPKWAANNPPGTSGRGFYERTKGWMMKTGNGYRIQAGKESENLGRKWYIKPNGFNTKVGNPVSYAAYLHGDNQVNWAINVGWRKLSEVASEKVEENIAIYERHIQALIRRLGLD